MCLASRWRDVSATDATYDDVLENEHGEGAVEMRTAEDHVVKVR